MNDDIARWGGWFVEGWFVDDRVTPELLSCLLDEQGGALALYAAQWTDAADDCVQEALIELAGQPRLPTNVVGWLYRVVRNRAISQFRAARRRERRESLAMRLRPAREGEAPAEPVDSEELAEALEALPDELREVVVARTWGGLNFEQIAELAGCSTSTAQRRYEAGLVALRERLRVPCPTNTKIVLRIPTR
jgi:RNA polymerase sigma-70 factor (ECF subfamily)